MKESLLTVITIALTVLFSMIIAAVVGVELNMSVVGANVLALLLFFVLLVPMIYFVCEVDCELTFGFNY